MAKARKKREKLSETEAYQPWTKSVIPAESRSYPPGNKDDWAFSKLLEEPRTVFDPKGLVFDDIELTSDGPSEDDGA